MDDMDGEGLPMIEETENSNHKEEEEDLFYAIEEEDDEEDSFEREKREKKENLQSQYEKKIDELEKKFPDSFFKNV